MYLLLGNNTRNLRGNFLVGGEGGGKNCPQTNSFGEESFRGHFSSRNVTRGGGVISWHDLKKKFRN